MPNPKDDIERYERKVRGLLNIGRSLLIKNSANLDSASAFYEQGIKEWHEDKVGDAYSNFDKAENEVMKVLGGAGIIKRIQFTIIKRSLAPITISIIFIIIYLYLLHIILNMEHSPVLLGIPLWAALIGGFGGCIGVIWSVTIDQKDCGIVPSYDQLWYGLLPIVGLSSGFLIYILIDTGILALGGIPTELGGNATATVPQQTLESIRTETRMLYCFIAGFWTNKLFESLNALLEKLLETLKKE